VKLSSLNGSGGEPVNEGDRKGHGRLRRLFGDGTDSIGSAIPIGLSSRSPALRCPAPSQGELSPDLVAVRPAASSAVHFAPANAKMSDTDRQVMARALTTHRSVLAPRG
jgi:hypothetical protein